MISARFQKGGRYAQTGAKTTFHECGRPGGAIGFFAYFKVGAHLRVMSRSYLPCGGFDCERETFISGADTTLA